MGKHYEGTSGMMVVFCMLIRNWVAQVNMVV